MHLFLFGYMIFEATAPDAILESFYFDRIIFEANRYAAVA